MVDRDFLARVVASSTDEKVTKKAQELINKYDNRDKDILRYLADGKIRTASEIMMFVDCGSLHQTVYLLKHMVTKGEIVQTKIKVPNKGLVCAYSIR
jgi:phosphopantetheine adenylyltransferase